MFLCPALRLFEGVKRIDMTRTANTCSINVKRRLSKIHSRNNHIKESIHNFDVPQERHNGKHFSIDVEDMDDVEATVSRKFRNGHRLAEEYLKKRDSSSDDEELRAFAKQSNNHYRVTFQDDDEEFEGGHVFNKETKMTNDSSKDFKYNIPSLSMETRVLHIERRGVFAEDYCFANVRNSFSQAVREVLEKASEWTCRSDAMHNYRRLRQRNLKLENQAVGILDDQDSHKVGVKLLLTKACFISHLESFFQLRLNS